MNANVRIHTETKGAPPTPIPLLRFVTTPSQRCWYEEVVTNQGMGVGGVRKVRIDINNNSIGGGDGR